MGGPFQGGAPLYFLRPPADPLLLLCGLGARPGLRRGADAPQAGGSLPSLVCWAMPWLHVKVHNEEQQYVNSSWAQKQVGFILLKVKYFRVCQERELLLLLPRKNTLRVCQEGAPQRARSFMDPRALESLREELRPSEEPCGTLGLGSRFVKVVNR